MSTENETELEGERLLGKIGDNVYLTVLRVHWPRMAYKIDDAVVEVATRTGMTVVAQDKRSTPAWSLMPEAYATRFITLERRARTAIAPPNSAAFASDGMYMVPTRTAATVFSNLREIREQFNALADEFVANFDQVLADLRLELGDELYEIAKPKIPSKASLRDKFKIVWAVFPTGSSNSVPISKEQSQSLARVLRVVETQAEEFTSPRDLECAREVSQWLHQVVNNRMARVDDARAAELVAEAKAQMSLLTSEMLDSMCREPRKAIYEAVEHVMSLIKAGTKLRSNSFNKIERAFEEMRNFEFLADSELLSKMRECSQVLGNTDITAINNHATGVGESLTTMLRGVLDAASNEKAIDKTQRSFRRIAAITVD